MIQTWLDNIFQMGWNHLAVICIYVYLFNDNAGQLEYMYIHTEYIIMMTVWM